MQWFVNLMEELGIECPVGHPAELGELAGDLVLGVLNVFAEGQERKKLVAAGNAAEGRDAERTPEGSAETFGELRGDALDLNVAADGAVRGEQVGERRGARTKARGTARTTPWNITQDAGEIVKESPSARAAALGGTTCWANHQSEKPPG
jgi:hypothetical protein